MARYHSRFIGVLLTVSGILLRLVAVPSRYWTSSLCLSVGRLEQVSVEISSHITDGSWTELKPSWTQDVDTWLISILCFPRRRTRSLALLSPVPSLSNRHYNRLQLRRLIPLGFFRNSVIGLQSSSEMCNQTVRAKRWSFGVLHPADGSSPMLSTYAIEESMAC